MNERIKELIEKATTWEGMIDGYIFDKEKFAELIVRECIDILPEKVKIYDIYDANILVQCGTAIKQHFGVEE